LNIVQTIASGYRNGIEQVAEGYARGVSGAGSKIITLADIPTELHENFIIKNSQFIAESWISGPWKRWDIPAVLRTRKLMHESFVDACIYHNGNSIEFINLCKPSGAPLVSVCHNEKLGLRLYADIILCLNDAQRDSAIKSLGRRAKDKLVATIGNPLVLPAVENPAGYANKRLRNKQVVIGTLSSIEPRKGLDILIKSLALMRNQGFDLKVRMAGQSPQPDRPDAYDLAAISRALGVEDAIEFVEWVEDRDAFFDTLDIFCLPSHGEAFGLALIEAMSRGLPSCASYTNGPAYIIGARPTGWLFEIGNADDLATQLTKMVLDRDETRARALAGLEYVEANFDAVAIGKKIVDLIDQYKSGKRS
jgi:glycosyltransferase involved in cell wall biosynthesis